MHAKDNIASRIGRWSAAHRKTAILGWLVFVVAVFGLMANGVLKKETLSSVDQIAGNAGEAERILDDAGMRPTEEIVLIESKSETVDDPGFAAVLDESAAALTATAHVTAVASPLDGNGGGISEDRHSAFVEFEIEGKEKVGEENLEASIATVDRVKHDNPEYTVGQFGGGSANKAIEDTLQADVGKAGMLSLPITLLILMIALGALVAASVPFTLALTSVLATMAMVTIPSHLFPLGGNVDALILLIGLAVGVDYSLFYMRRQREERSAGRSNRDAIEVAARTSGHAVMISGLTVAIAMAGMFITGDATFTSFAVATVTVVAVSMFVTLAVLPAVLSWLGDRVDKGRVPFTRRRGEAKESRVWGSIVTRVMRRPIVSIVVAGGFLVALAIPALGMNVVQSGPNDLPRDIPVMQTYDRFTAAFPEETNAVNVVVESDNVRGGAAGAAIDDLVTEAAASPKVIGESEITYSDDATVASVQIPTVGEGTDEQSMAALDEIRDEIVPATVGGVEDTTVKVTGGAAQSSDFSDLLSSRMPLVFAFVLGLAFLLMLITFRSIVIPLKAIVLNLLSVGAAYGVLVLVFQEGWGEALLGFESNGGVTNWLPLFLFVILFGLSMDYHVFILSRVREAYDRGMSTEDAVRKGIAGSAGTVTSAAIVMVMVFSVFATLSFIDFKEMGIGLAVAILIDATIIRGVLLPATMKLLGDWNWYLPKWLQWLPQKGREPRSDEGFEVEPGGVEPARA
ncbi:MAG TPA: MMPL family transporter [Solirubrobacterales bacterium]|nr:MMPL family transporter [Solirubrobacterales bacterium]